VYTPLLEKDIHNGRLRYGDKIFSYSDDFMFYMTTKDENQHFPPETCMLVTLLNFSITRVGLTNQLQNMLLTSLYPMQSQNLSNAYV
jgi:dynein heavy chain